MNNIFGLLFVILFGGAGLISIWIATCLLLPGPVQRTAAALEESLGRSLLLGLVNFLCVGVVEAILLWLAQLAGGLKVLSGILVIIGGLIALGMALLVLLGLAAFARVLGRRVDGSGQEFHTLLHGGALLLLAGFTPFVGWFVFTPLVALAGLGGAIQTAFRRPAAAAPDGV